MHVKVNSRVYLKKNERLLLINVHSFVFYSWLALVIFK